VEGAFATGRKKSQDVRESRILGLLFFFQKKKSLWGVRKCYTLRMDLKNNSHLRDHIVAIILSGLVAAGLAFFQSIGTSVGLSCQPIANPETAGVLGLLIKTAHSGWKLTNFIA
jgi:hypothetical protein